MPSLHDAVVAFLTEDGWFPEHDDDAVVCAFQGDAGTWPVYVLTQEEDRIVGVYSVAPVDTPVEHRFAVMEFITLLNAGLAVGCFEQDLESGQVRMRTSVDVEGTEWSDSLLRQLLHTNVLAMDRSLDALSSVAAGEATAREAHDLVIGS